MVGLGLATTDQAPEVARLKQISKLLDPMAALPPKLIELGYWISRYYLAPPGEVFHAMLPPEIELRHDREYWLTDTGLAHLQELYEREARTEAETSQLEFLRAFDTAGESHVLPSARVRRLDGGEAAATGAGYNREAGDGQAGGGWLGEEVDGASDGVGAVEGRA